MKLCWSSKLLLRHGEVSPARVAAPPQELTARGQGSRVQMPTRQPGQLCLPTQARLEAANCTRIGRASSLTTYQTFNNQHPNHRTSNASAPTSPNPHSHTHNTLTNRKSIMADNTRGGGHRGGGRGGGGGFRGRGGGGGGGGGHRGGRGGQHGGGNHHHQEGGGERSERPKKENILDLSKYQDKEIRVKFAGGREGAFSFFLFLLLPLPPNPYVFSSSQILSCVMSGVPELWELISCGGAQ